MPWLESDHLLRSRPPYGMFRGQSPSHSYPSVPHRDQSLASTPAHAQPVHQHDIALTHWPPSQHEGIDT